ncbi:hypothetical protein BT96DRAFT_999284 [Gymnopus androsaceus JB14]|uniref:Uncharacterized protein n=1 Tax=Gymnopus androsaceus JB14 TaxID=1447944 RepID=A0A6A4H7E5_9AGAR|nr:hypothetical protein BT96DRAFT_999284 [Gymnopus androsaceus JB14]
MEQTLGARAVHEEATAALRPLLVGVQTTEDLLELLEGLRDIRHIQDEEHARDWIQHPPVLNPKG